MVSQTKIALPPVAGQSCLYHRRGGSVPSGGCGDGSEAGTAGAGTQTNCAMQNRANFLCRRHAPFTSSCGFMELGFVANRLRRLSRSERRLCASLASEILSTGRSPSRRRWVRLPLNTVDEQFSIDHRDLIVRFIHAVGLSIDDNG